MNTAARLLNQNTVSRTWVVSFLLSKTQISFIVLIAAMLASALSVVYVSNEARTLQANIQQTVAERQRLHVEWSQLLLEKSIWVTQSRIQQEASGKLDMIIPDSKSVVIIN